MKIAVINFSGNVGKSTIAKHLLTPRIKGSELIVIESINAHEGEGPQMRGRQFGELQEYLQTVDSVVVDIGASNVEELLALMRKYRGSHDDFDYFVIPTVPALKQQRDTAATIAELIGIGVPADRFKIVFNMMEDDTTVEDAFAPLLAFLAQEHIAPSSTNCKLGLNELYGRLKAADHESGAHISALASDTTDYKALIRRAPDMADKARLAHKLAMHRLAQGVVPELDACFAALELA